MSWWWATIGAVDDGHDEAVLGRDGDADVDAALDEHAVAPRGGDARMATQRLGADLHEQVGDAETVAAGPLPRGPPRDRARAGGATRAG